MTERPVRKVRLWIALGGVVLALQSAGGAYTYKYAVQISAVTQTNPPRITLNWRPDPFGVHSNTIYRKARDATSWGAGVVLPGIATNYIDTNVTIGVAYEYQITKAAVEGYTGYGYIYSGINVPPVENRGTLLLIVATNTTVSLSNELSRLESDLIGDGWRVRRHNVSSNDTPAAVRSVIVNDYNADPAGVKAVFLFGHVPILHSGNLDYDGHLARPMPADAYYADIDGDWSSSPDYLPSDVELMVGRVDLFNMPGAGAAVPWPNETELLRRYLNKDHAWRHKLVSVPALALIGDRREEENGLATAADGFRNFQPLVGIGNILEANVADNAPIPQRWNPMLNSGSYLWAFGCGGGFPSGISHLGTNGQYNESWSIDVVGGDARAVFVMLFGSWFGNWDNLNGAPDNYLRSFLATPSLGLAACMAGKPHWFVHHMGLGEPIGFSTRLTMNNQTLYQNHTNPFARAIYISLMGDPALRQDPVAPPSNLSSQLLNGNVTLSWQASTDAVPGYYVYRADFPAGPFARITSSWINGTAFTDTNAAAMGYTYMVRAVKLQTTPSGTYYNLSQGIFNTAGFTPDAIQVRAHSATNGLVLTWNSVPGTVYRVQAATNLNNGSPGWSNASGEIMAEQTTTSWTDTTFNSAPRRFYRVAIISASDGATNSGIELQTWAEDGGLTLTWNSSPGIRYNVLAADSLAQPQWTDASGNLVAVGPITSWIDTAFNSFPQRFYRVAAATQKPPWFDTALSPEQRSSLLLSNLTLAEKIDLIHGAPGPYVGNTPDNLRLGIPGLRLQDGPAGVADGVQGVTALPAPILLAATWDTVLARQYGEVLGEEARGKGVTVLLGPTINLVRVPQSGRAFETFGEDPLLSSAISAAHINGVQSQGVIATAKHFIANEQETNRGNANSHVDERTLRQIYLPPFLASVRAGVGAIMTAYNQINGDWSSDTPLLNAVLKTNWGFKGFVLSDWGANFSMEKAFTNGLDLEMPAGTRFGDSLKTAIQSGALPVPALDDKVRRILMTQFRAGLFDQPPTGNVQTVVFTPSHALAARDIASAGIVVLKNRGDLLPLTPAALDSIAVSGAAGGDAPIWTGHGSAEVFYFPYYDTPLNAVSNRAGAGIEISYIAGETNISAAVQLAQQADVALVCVGEQTGEGADRASLALSVNADALVEAVAASNTNTIVVLYAGAGTLMPWATNANVAAILVAWYPGLEGAQALASVLFGDVNPSGRLPVTFPVSSNDLPARLPYQYPGTNLQVIYSEALQVGYRWYDASNVAPLYPFGHGLSYTRFEYTNLAVSTVSPSGQVRISFDLNNIGSRPGADVAQCYLGFPASAGEPPRQLKAFKKIHLMPGQTNRVQFDLDWESLARWDTNSQSWTVPQGVFQVMIGASSRDIRLTNSFAVTSPVAVSGQANLALFQTVIASSAVGPEHAELKAVDGDTITAWNSTADSPQWIVADLGSQEQLHRIRFRWGSNYASQYQLETSADNMSWTTVYATSTGVGGVEDILVAGSGRFVRLTLSASATGLGYSLAEWEIYAET